MRTGPSDKDREFVTFSHTQSDGDEARELQDLKYALDQSSIVAFTDSKGVITYVNDTFCKISKYSREELIGKTHKILNSGYHSKEFFKDLWGTISQGQVWKGQIRNKAKDGSYYWVDSVIIPFLDKENRPYQYIAIRKDITEEKRLQDEVVRQDRLVSIGVLASGLAHEIGTPLGVIRGRSEILLSQFKTEEKLENGLGIIIKQIDRISKLVDSLLRYSRAPQVPNIESKPFLPTIREIASLLDEKLRKRNIEFITEIPQDFMGQFDDSRFQQILLNLLINSLQAFGDDKSSQEKFIKIEALDSESFAGIRISDNGCGITEENLNRVFDPFFTTKDIGEGTGLGLAIVEKLVREMNGSIEVESKVGEGTTFTVAFPR